MKEIVAEVTQLARRSPKINQRSGVSVRISITNYEPRLQRLAPRATDRRDRGGAAHHRPAVDYSLERRQARDGDLEEGDDETVLQKIIKTAVLTSSGATSRPPSSTSWCSVSTPVSPLRSRSCRRGALRQHDA